MLQILSPALKRTIDIRVDGPIDLTSRLMMRTVFEDNSVIKRGEVINVAGTIEWQTVFNRLVSGEV